MNEDISKGLAQRRAQMADAQDIEKKTTGRMSEDIKQDLLAKFRDMPLEATRNVKIGTEKLREMSDIDFLVVEWEGHRIELTFPDGGPSQGNIDTIPLSEQEAKVLWDKYGKAHEQAYA